MTRTLKLVIPLLFITGGLAAGGAWVIDRHTTEWFQRDIKLRVELAVNGAHDALTTHFASNDEKRLEKVLADITKDVRILGATACSQTYQTVAETEKFPEVFACTKLPALIGSFAPRDNDLATQVGVFPFGSGRAHIGIVPVVGRANNEPINFGYLVLVHDLAFADRRGELARTFLFAMIAALVLLSLVANSWVASFSWRRWSMELAGFLRGKPPSPKFRPFLSDVRELLQRLSLEDEGGPGWTAQRLKRLLNTQLHQERVLVLANREPYIHEHTAGGGVQVMHPASGLVTALEPVMRACSGVWVAHGSGSADKDYTSKTGTVAVPPEDPSYTLKRVWLTKEEENGYYYGFANEGMWPLCHAAHVRPVFRSQDFAHYQTVNERFANAAVEEADSVEPIILVQDYHFTLAPKMLRRKLPRATVVTFFHIPWPTAERLGMCPWFLDLLKGLLGSSILSFHTQAHCNNFIDAVDRYLEARIDREQQAIIHMGHTTLVRSYPISLEWPPPWVARVPKIPDCRDEIVARHGLPKDALIGVGVDRIDYTKGIEERLLAVERLLELNSSLHGRFFFIQLGAPSRTAIEEYSRINQRVEDAVVRINLKFSRGDYRPIIFLRDHHEPLSVYRYYRAANVCYVSSLHDGMNLVAKEFVAAREDNQGVLVLSRFTGAAKELSTALIVNPYDIDGAANALYAGVTMRDDEQRERMLAMRSLLAEFNVYRWAGKMLVDASKARHNERLRDRLGQ